MASKLTERSCEQQDIVILFAIMSKIQLLIIKVHSMNFKLAKNKPNTCYDLEFVIGLDTRSFSREVQRFEAANWRVATHRWNDIVPVLCQDKVLSSILTGVGLELVVCGVHDEVLPRDQEVNNKDLWVVKPH